MTMKCDEPLGLDVQLAIGVDEQYGEARKDDDKSLLNNVKNAMEYYRKRFGKHSDVDTVINHRAFPWCAGEDAEMIKGAEFFPQEYEPLCMEKDSVSGSMLIELVANDCARKAKLIDADGEDITLCQQCGLPVGEMYYSTGSNNRKEPRHGECMGETLAKTLRKKVEIRERREEEERIEQREKYGIGWKVEHIPRNDAAASKLALREVPLGMVCLVLDEDTESIHVAAAAEPASAINLEYLSVALQVRRREGHEPIFSLEPVDPEDKNTLQDKVFLPEWLADTVAGHVLFQADYHLKELSLGDHSQPIVGMKSPVDYAASKHDFGDWSGREWFVVRKAEMHMSESNILIPFLKMGVEAREQVLVGSHLEDKPLTRPDHPMVQFANAFTQNFDLIAERKSVIYHLRELAKASVLAKFLLDAGIDLGDSWFNLSGENRIPSVLRIPQLWYRREDPDLQIKDGTVKFGSPHKYRVFGGVQFGLERFNLAGNVFKAPPGRSSLTSARLRTCPPVGVQPSASLSARMPSFARLGSRKSLSSSFAPISSGQMSIASKIASSSAHPPALVSKRDLLSLAPPPKVAADLQRIAAPRLVSGILGPKPGPHIPKIISDLGRIRGLTGAPSNLAAASFIDIPKDRKPNLPTSHRFDIGQVPPLLVLEPPKLAPPSGALSAAQFTPPRATLALSAALAATKFGTIPRLQASSVPPTAQVQPPDLQGVDLRLDSFDLTSVKRVSMEAQEGSWGSEAKPLDNCISISEAFWAGLEPDSETFTEDDRMLLNDIYNPQLCDRRLEGNLFVPPDASHAYVTKLRSLIKTENAVRCSRKEHFFSKSFALSRPGPLFPSTWNTPILRQSECPQRFLRYHPDYKSQAAVLLQHARSSSPIFDKTAEDGVRFRIYHVGRLELRTSQDRDASEEVGAVFSKCEAPRDSKREKEIIEDDTIVKKATVYVEPAFGNIDRYRYFLVLETESGDRIVTERLTDGSFTWEENPDDFEDRCAWAKSLHCHAALPDLTARDMKVYRSMMSKALADVTAAASKHYTRSLYRQAVSASGQMAPMPGCLM